MYPLSMIVVNGDRSFYLLMYSISETA